MSDHIVMESVEHDEEHADSRGEAKDSLLRESIWLEPAILESSYQILFFLTAAIEGS